jgi:23S rRNA pseudouridine1911/1915/1917 synthase
MPPERAMVLPLSLAGERLDRVLVELSGGSLSRTRVQELIRDGGVRVDGEVVRRPALRLAVGQEIAVVEVPRTRLRSGGPVGGELTVVHEDEDLAVIDKPAGQLTHPTTVVQGGTVSELATARWGRLPAPQGVDRPGIVHRLDADTSGLLVIAKTERAASPLVAAFRARAVTKRYAAVVHGEPRFDSDWISAAIGRSDRRSDRMRVVPEGEGRPAATFYRTEERFAGFARLECLPRTGRTHQIRVHLASIEHPIVGDRVYPGRVRVPLPAGAPPLGRHLLHASGLEFPHPVSGVPLALRSELPADFRAWIDWLRAREA